VETSDRLISRLADVPVVVVSPALLLSVTVERGAGGGDEIHLHPAGQGYWVARMVRALGGRPILVTTSGGEAADVAAAFSPPDLELRLVRVDGPGGVYVDDRRDGARNRVATTPPAPLDRHSVDDLVAATIADGVANGIVVLTGSNDYSTVKPRFFADVAAALRAVDVPVVVDLSGAELDAAADAGVDAVKVADDELRSFVGNGGSDLVIHAAALRERAGADVFVTLAGDGALADTEDGRFSARGPRLRSVEPRGAGDSFTAALAVARRAGLDVDDQLRIAMAAAATNVLRHGLGSAMLDAVRSMLDHVVVDGALG
jgi:1-phosphofructokinase